MLSNIITKINQRILKILLDEKASLSEIARKSSTTKANVFRCLKNLEKEDFVRKEVKGRTHIYKFNFLHPAARELNLLFISERKKEYVQKMNGLPELLHLLFKNMFKENYQGCIFFGSSLEGKYNDIDVFVVLEDTKGGVLRKEVKKINEKISLVLGNKNELEKGVGEEDMLYKNIVKGIPFGCEELVIELRQRQEFLRRKDITERFVLGYREIISCLEFDEREYVKRHLNKGVMDVMYATLNYLDFFPENDNEANEMFKKQFGFVFSHEVNEAKRQAERIGRRFL